MHDSHTLPLALLAMLFAVAQPASASESAIETPRASESRDAAPSRYVLVWDHEHQQWVLTWVDGEG